MRERLIADYHKTLTMDECLTPKFFAHLKSKLRERKLTYAGREIAVALRPHFLTRRQYDNLARSSEALAGALETAASFMLSEPSRIKTVGLTERETRLALASSRSSPVTVTSRFDAFVNGDEIKFVEYNAENPSSLSDQGALNEVLYEVPALRLMQSHYQLTQFCPERRLLQALMNAFRRWGGTGVPNIAIVDWKDLPTANEFLLLQKFFVNSGVPTTICAPEDLEYEGGRLRFQDFPIDLVYKRVIINELLARCDDTHPIISAYLAGDVCMVNSLGCKLVHKKASFEILTDEANAGLFTSREREVIHRTVPWTRRVTSRTTLHRGQEVDLVEYVRKNRNYFVLKPNDDYGGHGIVIGEKVSESEWESALSEGLKGDYVVQEKIRLRTEIFPIFDDSQWALQPMYVDTNPFLFDGRVEGAMVRLSDSPVVNVTSGGSETGFFVIEDQA